MNKHLYITLSICLLALHTHAQRYPFYSLDVEDGLIQSQVTTLSQDANGHLWIGTLGGMSRYDGNSFTNYTVRKNLLSNSIQTIVTDKNNNLWIGGPKGISKFNGKKFEHYLLQSPENGVGNQPRDIKVAPDNTVWCYTDTSVYRIVNNKVVQLPLPDSNIVVTSILPTKDTLYVGSNNGRIFRYYNNNWDSVFYYVPSFNKPAILTTGIFKARNGKIYLTTRSGLFQLNNDTARVVVASGKPLYNIPLISIAEDKQGAIWLGSAGAYKLQDGKLEQFNRENGFTDNAITSILTDDEGNVWLGSDGQGVFRFSGTQISILDDESSALQSEQVVSIASAPNGRVYIGTYVDGLFSYYNNDIVEIPLKYSKVYVTSLAINSEYDVWMGTNGLGLWRLRGTQRYYYNRPELPSNTIISLYKDTANKLWVGTSSGAAIYNKNKFEILNIPSSAVMSFITIGDDSTIIATDNGLLLYSYKDTTSVPFAENAKKDIANAQCLALQGYKLWVGTRDNGLVCYDLRTNKYFVLNSDNGLQSDFVYNVIIDDNNDLWAGTGFGIHKIEMDGDRPQVSFYGKEQGITGMESNHNAVAKTNDGLLWFGTMKGLVRINPKTEQLQPSPISIVLQSLKLFGDNIRDTTYFDSTDSWYEVPYQLQLPHKKNNLTFTFRGISLSGSQQLVYRYRMEGLEAPWSDWSALNSITYSALPPGKYKLYVECKRANGEQVKSLTYPFEIITPFHKTKWFSITILALCIFSGVGIQYLLNRRKQNREQLVQELRREEQNKVRQRTAEDFHDELGNKLTRINILTSVLQDKIGNLSPDNKRIIDQIQDNTAQLYGGTKDILWSLQPANDNLNEILNRVKDFAIELFEDTNITFELVKSNEQQWQQYRLPLDMSRNFIMIFKEALNNTLKYANATEVKMEATIKDLDTLHIMLKDNGDGFNVEEVVKGNGLNNMRNRAERLKGKLYIDSTPKRGTTINLHFRIQRKNGK